MTTATILDSNCDHYFSFSCVYTVFKCTTLRYSGTTLPIYVTFVAASSRSWVEWT